MMQRDVRSGDRCQWKERKFQHRQLHHHPSAVSCCKVLPGLVRRTAMVVVHVVPAECHSINTPGTCLLAFCEHPPAPPCHGPPECRPRAPLPLWCSGPPVTYPKYDPTIIQCTAPGGSPWATCELSLCPQTIGRRRHLLEPPAPCTPITTSCAFDQNTGLADCDLAGLVEQDIPHAVNSTAVKSDGTRKSQVAVAGNQYTLPRYP